MVIGCVLRTAGSLFVEWLIDLVLISLCVKVVQTDLLAGLEDRLHGQVRPHVEEK